MQRSSVCQECKQRLENDIREKGFRGHTKREGVLISDKPRLELEYINSPWEVLPVRYDFDITHCCACGKAYED